MADKKVVDIAGPEDAKVDIGSKPMIVGHKSLASDPMVREAKAEDNSQPIKEQTVPAESAETEVKAPPQQKIIAPINTEKASEPENVFSVKENVPADNKTPDIEPQKESQTTKEVEKTEDSKVESTKTEEPKPDEPKAEGVVLKENVANKENEEAVAAMEQEKKLQEMIDSKKYRVSIKQARNSSRMLFVILMCVLAGLFASIYLLVDSGKLDLGFNVPVSIIGQSEDSSKSTTVVVAEVEKNDEEETQPTNQEISTKTWFTFDNPDYSMRIPDGWVMSKKESSESSIYSKQAVYTEGKAGVVEEFSNEATVQEEENVFVLDVTAQPDVEYCTKNYAEGDVSTLKTDSGLTIYKKVERGSVGEVITTYCIQAEEKSYESSYTLYKGDSDQTVYAEKAVMSIKPR